MDSKEFAQDRRIDPDQLDVEALRQPELFYKWAERAVLARTAVDQTKLELEILEAGLRLECQRDPEKFKLAKTTEESIKAAVKTHPKYRRASERHIQAKEESAFLEKAVKAMDDRKRMLEGLITLHGQSYFAGPAVPRNLGEAYMAQRDEAEKRSVERQRKKTRRRRVKVKPK